MKTKKVFQTGTNKFHANHAPRLSLKYQPHPQTLPYNLFRDGYVFIRSSMLVYELFFLHNIYMLVYDSKEWLGNLVLSSTLQRWFVILFVRLICSKIRDRTIKLKVYYVVTFRQFLRSKTKWAFAQ